MAYMTIRTIEYLLGKFGSGKSPGSADYVDLIDTLADDRNAVYFASTAPEDTSANPLWFNTSTQVLNIYNNGSWISGSGGETGPAGPQGDPGVDGEDALWNFTGAYNLGASYAVGDVATYNGETWYRIDAHGGNTGDTPSEGAYWTLIAQKGVQGIQGEQGADGSAMLSVEITANTSLVSGSRYFVTSSSALTLTLPSSPALNDEIQVIDASENASVYNITIARNGNKINGIAGNLIVDNDGGWYTLLYTGTTYGWKVG